MRNYDGINKTCAESYQESPDVKYNKVKTVHRANSTKIACEKAYSLWEKKKDQWNYLFVKNKNKEKENLNVNMIQCFPLGFGFRVIMETGIKEITFTIKKSRFPVQKFQEALE